MGNDASLYECKEDQIKSETRKSKPEIRRVLLVEDNPGDARLIREMLAEVRTVSFDMEWADRLSTGLKQLARGGIHALLLDLSLPDSQGLETFANVHAKVPTVPIIVLTGLDDEATAVEAVGEGAQDYLVKGQVDSNLLGRAIRYAIGRKKMEQALRESEEKYRLLIENANEAVLVAQDEKHKFVNANMVRMTGYSEEELMSGPFLGFIHPDDRKMVVERYRRRLKGDKLPHIYPFRIIDKGGNTKWMEINAAKFNWKGKPGTLSLLTDITERKRAEDDLKSSEERLKILFEFAPDGVYLNDLKGTFIDGNRAAEKLTGYKREELIGKSFVKMRLLPRRQIPKAAALLAKNALGKSTGPDEFTLNRKDGKQVTAEISTHPVRIRGESLVLGIARDLTERKKAEETVRQMAYQDPLTGLPNRRLFNDRLTLALAHAKRKWQKVAVMLLDLDYFKEVNDTLGHKMGDKLLQAVAYRLANVLRRSDTIARLGGDEFILLLPEIARVEDTAQIAQKILEDFREPFVLDGHKLHITTSIGISVYPNDGRDGDTLMKNADIAMYRVKEVGRNNYQRYSLAMRAEQPGELQAPEASSKRAEAAFVREKGGLRLLQQITAAVHSTLDLEKVFRKITDGVVYSLGYTTAFILTLDGAKMRFEVKALSAKKRLLPQIDRILGFSLRNFSFPADSELNANMKSVMKGKVVVAKTLAEVAYPLISKRVCSILQKLAATKNYIVLPLKIERDMVGAVFITSPRDRVLEEELGVLQTFARAASQAVRNANLHRRTKQTEEALRETFEKLRRALEGTVRALTTAVEAKDPYTGGHQQRVTTLACAIAKEMGLSEDKVEGIRVTGFLHDIGKIVIPVEILSKPGQLSETDFSIIKQHPQVGYEILKGLDFPWPVAEAILQHHERLDGSGYPQGLSGNEIILEARVLAVADVVEAMSSHRPYRPALGIDRALEEISQNRNILYDPEVADACVRLLSEKGFEFEQEKRIATLTN